MPAWFAEPQLGRLLVNVLWYLNNACAIPKTEEVFTPVEVVWYLTNTCVVP